jgi:hypothetical protein
MATLTETAYYARRGIKYGAIFIVFLIFARVIWMTGTRVYLYYFPPPLPAPEVAFGKLPPLVFPDRAEQTYTFVLQTTTGELPTLPEQGLVYFMPQATSSLTALDDSTKIALNLGFNGKVTPQSDTIYRFERDRSAQSLDINIINKTFSINFDLTQTPDLLETRPDSTADTLQIIRGILSATSLIPKDLETGPTTFEYLKVENGLLVEKNSLSDASFVKVNYFRRNYSLTQAEKSDVPVLTPDNKNGNVWFIVSGDPSRDKSIIGGEFHYFPVEEGKKSTYPLKTAQTAWDQLNAGKAFIARGSFDSAAQITIRKIYMAYYDSGRPQDFLQPIVVFEGTNGFLAYVPAITGQYYSDPKFAEATPDATPK